MGVFVGIGVSHYDHDPPYPEIKRAVPDVEQFSTELQAQGYEVEVIRDPSSTVVRQKLSDWRKSHGSKDQPPLVLLWAGHGVTGAAGKFVLATADSPENPTSDDGYPPPALMESVATLGFTQILIIMDTCFSGEGVDAAMKEAIEALKNQSFPGRMPWVAVLASCLPLQRSEDGLLADHLLRLLRTGPTGGRYMPFWSEQNRYIYGTDLLEAFMNEWVEPGQEPLRSTWGGVSQRMFANPRYLPNLGDRLVEHIVLETGEEDWFFSGRRTVLAQIVEWLRSGRPGVFVVTGPPGCGKSAVVGRIASLSDPRERQEIMSHGGWLPGDPDPGEGSIRVRIWAKNKTLQDLISITGEQLGETRATTVPELIDFVKGDTKPLTIVVDALDEAAPGECEKIVKRFIGPISRVALILLATRNPIVYLDGDSG